MSILEVNAQADAAMADMLLQNARQIQANSIRETAALSIFCRRNLHRFQGIFLNSNTFSFCSFHLIKFFVHF